MLLAGLLVLVMASPLYAAPDIKVNGQIRTRLRYWVDIDLDSDRNVGTGTTQNHDRRYFDNRTRLGVDAKLSDGVRAVIQLEKYFDFGNIGPNSARSNTIAGASTLATPSDTSQDMYLRQAWIDFAIPGLQEEGIRFQAGRSFFRVGHGFLWGNSLTGEDGFTLYGPLGPGNFKIRWAFTQNQSVNSAGRSRLFDNELQHYAIDYKFEVAEKQNLELYYIGQVDRAVDNIGSVGVQDSFGTPVRHGNDHFFGASYDGVAGPVALSAEAAYQFGKTRQNTCLTAAGGPAATAATCVTPGSGIDRQAFFGYGEATYKVTPAWNVGAAFTFATGDDDPNDDNFDNFVGPLAEFTTSPTRVWTDSQFFFGDRSTRRLGNATTNRAFNYWGRGTDSVDRAASVGDNGTLYSPGLFELQFKTKYTFSKQVTGLFNIIPTWAANHPDDGGRYMGTEIDGKIAYKPYKNLVVNGYFGYFVSGGFFDVSSTGTAFTPGVTKSADDAWMFRSELIVTF
jgi:hypothetical protein